MKKVAVMMSSNNTEEVLSGHFGKAPWIMFAEFDQDSRERAPRFVANDGMNGRSAASLAVENGCTDVILLEIGDGALRRLQTANVRVWSAPGPVSGHEALRLFANGELSLVPAAIAATRQGEHHGCCCAGHYESGTEGCCHG